MRNTIKLSLLLVGAVSGSGCVYDEGLIIQNLKGTVAIPVEAATRDFVDIETGETYTVVDSKLIGPVFIGLYASVTPADTIASYPHPEIGPQYKANIQGDTYPYGGTTIGDVRFACYEFLRCKVASGRYENFDALASWFAETLQQPIVDKDGTPVLSGELIEQTCFDLLEVTTDLETRVTVGDTNGDEKIDEKDLDFQLSGDGQWFEAEFTIWQQDWYWDQNQENCEPGVDCTGPTPWAFMDSPSISTFQFTTCNPSDGFQVNWYDQNFYGGTSYRDVLNQPSTYITSDDWVSDRLESWDDTYDHVRIELNHRVTR